jgi:alkylhydroperoxidase family enzyme
MSKEKLPVTLVNKSDDPEVTAIYEKLADTRLGIVNIHRTIANSPTIFTRFVGLAHALRLNISFDPADRELAILRVLARHNGTYEIHHHSNMAAENGLSDKQIAAALAKGEPADLFNERQRAVLRFAERFAAGEGVEAAESAEILKHLDNRQLVELGMVLTLYTGLAYFTAMLDVPGD